MTSGTARPAQNVPLHRGKALGQVAEVQTRRNHGRHLAAGAECTSGAAQIVPLGVVDFGSAWVHAW
jgi:hypothetical protein